MNFQKIPPVPDSHNLVESAFRKARIEAAEREWKGPPLEKNQKRELFKIEIIRNSLCQKLIAFQSSFPEIDRLPAFYQKLIHLTLDYAELRKSLAALIWASTKIKGLYHDIRSKITVIDQARNISALTNQFYGRLASIMKQIQPNLKYLQHARHIMRSYPDIKEGFTVCLYGFPNVGKSTLLNNLTNTKAEVAAYAFTTKGINTGYFIKDERIFQILDVPGTLARKEKMNSIELIAELVATELADLVIFVLDLSGYSGYNFEEQEQLYQKISLLKPTLVYVSKMDITPAPEMEKWKGEFYTLEELKEELSKRSADWSQ